MSGIDRPDLVPAVKPDVIEVGPSVRLYSLHKAACQFAVTAEKFREALDKLGVPRLSIEGEEYLNLSSLESVLFAALRPWKGRSFALGEDVVLPPSGSPLRLMYERKLAALTFSGAAWKELEQRVVEMAKILKKRAGKGNKPFGNQK